MRDGQAQHFDLNMEQVLEHWTVAHAIREVIANALDEAALTGSDEPRITRDMHGVWRIRDFGRGLRYEHLTQNENEEKLSSPNTVIGKFGVGLKDALATFDRHGIDVTIHSRHLHLVTDRAAKSGFADILTLHALIGAPDDPNLRGTEVELRAPLGSAVDLDAAVAEARSFFLRYSGEVELERTRYGSVVETAAGQASRIYVNGLRVAEEPGFLFSYNITSLTAALRRALNRERTNVGRTVYSDRVKAILLECQSTRVAQALALDLGNFHHGTMHDELQWSDVTLHASRILNTAGRVLFVTTDQLLAGGSTIQRAQEEGFQVIAVPGAVAAKFRNVTDLHGAPLRDLAVYQEEVNASFDYVFVDPQDLTRSEQAVYALTPEILRLLRFPGISRVRGVLIAESMRIGGDDEELLGLWEIEQECIIIRRSVLESRERYCAVLLHELAHAVSWADDLTFPFEQTLTHFIGALADQVLTARASSTTTAATAPTPPTPAPWTAPPVERMAPAWAAPVTPAPTAQAAPPRPTPAAAPAAAPVTPATEVTPAPTPTPFAPPAPPVASAPTEPSVPPPPDWLAATAAAPAHPASADPAPQTDEPERRRFPWLRRGGRS